MGRIYVYGDDECLRTVLGLVKAQAGRHSYAKSHARLSLPPDLFCGAVRLLVCRLRTPVMLIFRTLASITLASWAVWSVVVVLNHNVAASHELQLGLLQDVLDNLVPGIKQVGRA